MTAPVLLDKATADRWAADTQEGESKQLKNLLELRGILEDNEHQSRDWKAQLRREACGPLGKSKGDLDVALWTIEPYSDNDLALWFSIKGFYWSHLRIAKSVYEVAGYKSPSELISTAIEVGGKDGSPMTADELYDFAMMSLPSNGHEQKAANLYATFSRWSARVASRLGWDGEKRERFEREFAKLWKRYTKEG